MCAYVGMFCTVLGEKHFSAGSLKQNSLKWPFEWELLYKSDSIFIKEINAKIMILLDFLTNLFILSSLL